MIEVDYLVIGAGALGMAFVDQILTDTDASVAIVDRRSQPGGHWVDTYPFVRLHQPSAYYGVGSMELGANRIDSGGNNKGFYELASGPEIQAYFQQLMQGRLLRSGRVRYFPHSEYNGDGTFTSLTTGKSRQATAVRRIVDATYFTTCIPATQPPGFAIDDGVTVIAPNRLPESAGEFSRYTIVGGGKTAMDTGVWLLDNAIDPDRIRWIVPRDSWLINRETIQPGDLFYDRYLEATATQLEACAAAQSTDHLFRLLEEGEQLLRIDRSVKPAMYHSATISIAEVESLAKISDVVRKGHVKHIKPDSIVLTGGEVRAQPQTLYIDCSASGLTFKPTRPIFEEGRITLQMVRAGLFSLSAAVIAHVEAIGGDDDTRNHLCRPIALPDRDTDWLWLKREDMAAQQRWVEHGELRDWVASHRLSGANLREPGRRFGAEVDAARQRIRAASGPAATNLDKLARQKR